MITQQLTLVQRELDILKKHLQEATLTDFNKKKLLSELASAQVVSEDKLPENVIGLNSVVHVEERKSRKSFIFQIVPPAYADIKKNKIAVSAPIAIALLGYNTGSTIKWEMPGGVQQFEVLKVTRVNMERAV